LDKRTDIFSFGTVLFEMFTGVRPFEGETLSDTLASVLKEQPQPARIRPHALHSPVDAQDFIPDSHDQSSNSSV
jgi:serine/threonine protein kinase